MASPAFTSSLQLVCSRRREERRAPGDEKQAPSEEIQEDLACSWYQVRS